MSSYLALTSEQVKKTVEAVIKSKPVYAEILGFYAGVFDAQEDCKSRIQLEPLQLSDALQTAKASGKLPLIEIQEFTYDGKESANLFLSLCHLATRANPKLSATAGAILKAVETTIEPDALFSGLLNGNEALFENMASELEIEKPILGFFTYNSLKPSLCACAEQLAVYLDQNEPWLQGYCPICGSAPILSILENEGRRALVCSFCWHSWPAKRVHCPYCDSSQSQDLHYFYSEDEKNSRVDLCDNCKKYIKTCDTRNLARLIYPPLEQISTIHLDIRAQEMGYQPGIRQFMQV
ncbi:MAG: formate dehydrogenase accessory protein FdhE [Desulfobacteraceae bacterium]|jgi:FdhE protein|nr:formate dehydrogenase accessory protein FdhE [Desulfobacteraceae bacterium]